VLLAGWAREAGRRREAELRKALKDGVTRFPPSRPEAMLGNLFAIHAPPARRKRRVCLPWSGRRRASRIPR
jgi:hypothetical protein